MKICITGINSFVGQSLAAACEAAGYIVFGTSTDMSKQNRFNCVEWSLDLEPVKEWFAGVNVVIHLAWDVRTGRKKDNVAGTIKFAELAKQSGVQHQIFVSSCSAHELAQSEYGIGKFECEKYFLSNQMQVIRPGLVIGNGGGFKTLIDFVQKNNFIPLLDGGIQRVPVIGLHDLTEYLIAVINGNPGPATFKAFYCDSPQFKGILTTIRDVIKKQVFFISVDSKLILALIKVASILHLRLPISTDQVMGYRSNKKIDLVPTPINSIDLKKDIKLVIAHEIPNFAQPKNIEGVS